MTELTKEEFIAELIRLQASEADSAGAPHGDDMPTLVRLQMRYRAGDKLSARDADILKLCTQLFRNDIESLDCDSRLIKLAQRLQVPVLIAALQNSGFFGRDGHPARDLVGKISSVLLECSGASESEVSELSGQLQSVIDDLLADGTYSKASYEEAAARLENVSAGAAVPVNSAPPDAASARRRVAVELQRRFPPQKLPPILRELIEQGWSRVLYNTLLKGGEGSADWRDGLTLVDELVMSVAPDISIEQRNRMLENLPQWLEALRRGLVRAATLTPRMEKVLSDVQELIMSRVQSVDSEAAGEADVVKDPQLVEVVPGSSIMTDKNSDTAWEVVATPARAGLFVLRSPDGSELKRVPAAELAQRLTSGEWQHPEGTDVMVHAVDLLRQQSRDLRATNS